FSSTTRAWRTAFRSKACWPTSSMSKRKRWPLDPQAPAWRSRQRVSLLSPQLRQSLGRTRIVAGRAIARGGVGERKSRTKGEGIEFEDFRPYAFGDDLRRLDPHVHARLGQNVIRQYNVPERLSVSILLDTSESMTFGEPKKSQVALGVTTGLALCSLTGSDTVRCGALRDDTVDWYSRLSGAGRLEELEAWLTGRRFNGRV